MGRDRAPRSTPGSTCRCGWTSTRECRRPCPGKEQNRVMLRAVTIALAVAVPLCAASKLAVDRMALHQFEDGPVLDPGYEFLPGETAYFSCRLAGYKIETKD